MNTIDLQKKEFEKLVDTIMPELSLSQNDGIPPAEVRAKLMELFEKNREGMPGDSSMTGVLFRINYFFEGWLHFEKGLPEKRALELSMAVNNLLRSKMMEKIDKRSEGENAKILKFPPPENRRR